ncbi:MAG: hypothetical protein LBU43_06685 [Candidatus Accumulibacter sp.]|nr:hypothetical protein [Accumulibacter sp.]
MIDKNLLDQLSQDWKAYHQLEISKERQDIDTSLENTLTMLKCLADPMDISLILASEKLLLNQELSLYANSLEERNSVETALSQLEEAEQALLIVHIPEVYKNATRTYPAKHREKGLPLDGFREFIKSHSARLTNRLAGRLTVPEKEILRQRKINLGLVKSTYIALQQKTHPEAQA